MSNNTYGSGRQQPTNMNNPVPPSHDKIDRFFAWIRGSGLMRGNNRWIAGVCDGIAVRYGLSPVFVRAVVAASTLAFGFGAAFYAAAWVLLPDCRDGRISGEELVYGHWQWSLLGPIVFMVIAFCFPGIGVLLAIVAVAVLLIMINSLANKAQERRGFPFADNGQQGRYQGRYQQGQYQGQWQQPSQSQYRQSGPMPYSPSGNTNPNFYANANPVPYAPQSFGQSRNNEQTQSQGTDEATFRESENMKSDSGFGDSQQGDAGDAGKAYMQSAQHQQSNQHADGSDGQVSGRSWASPFVAGPSQANAAPPTYMAEPAQSYRESIVQNTAKTWGARRARRKPAGFVVVLLALGFILLSGALVAIQCFSNGGYMGTILQYGTYWIGGVLIALGVLIAVLGLTGHRAGGLHPLVWIAAFAAVVFLIGNIGYSVVLTESEQQSQGYHQVDVSGFKAIDAGNDQQLKKLTHGTAIKGHRLDDDAVNIDFSDYAKTHSTHDVTLKDGSTVKSGCPTGTIHLTDRKTTVFVTLPAGCSYRLSHGTNVDLHAQNQKRREDSKTSKPDTSAKHSRSDDDESDDDDECDEADGCETDDDDDDYIGDDDSDYYDGTADGSWDYRFCYGFCDGNLVMGSWVGDDPATGTKSLGSGYVAISRAMQVGFGGMSYQRIGYGSGYGNDQDYQWYTETKKMPKNGPELTVDAPYIVEGRVTVQYPAESTVPSYAQFVKGKTTGAWRR